MKTLRLSFIGCIFFMSFNALADNWICTEQASQRRGDTILACGVGIGYSERDARKEAFKSAKGEFKALCDTSFDCQYRPVRAFPKRTDCRAMSGYIKCYRGVEFQIMRGAKQVGSDDTVPVRLKIGMNKDDLIRIIGRPSTVSYLDLFGPRQIYHYYDNPYCKYSFCHIVIQYGKVVKLGDIKGEYIDL